MPDIIIEQSNKEILKRIRASSITIENPIIGNKKIIFNNSEAIYIDGTPEVEKPAGKLEVILDSTKLMEDITIISPIDGLEKTLKAAEVAYIIETFYVTEYLKVNAPTP
jgi:hypothetical protein